MLNVLLQVGRFAGEVVPKAAYSILGAQLLPLSLLQSGVIQTNWVKLGLQSQGPKGGNERNDQNEDTRAEATSRKDTQGKKPDKRAEVKLDFTG